MRTKAAASYFVYCDAPRGDYEGIIKPRLRAVRLKRGQRPEDLGINTSGTTVTAYSAASARDYARGLVRCPR